MPHTSLTICCLTIIILEQVSSKGKSLKGVLEGLKVRDFEGPSLIFKFLTRLCSTQIRAHLPKSCPICLLIILLPSSLLSKLLHRLVTFSPKVCFAAQAQSLQTSADRSRCAFQLAWRPWTQRRRPGSSTERRRRRAPGPGRSVAGSLCFSFNPSQLFAWGVVLLPVWLRCRLCYGEAAQ